MVPVGREHDNLLTNRCAMVDIASRLAGYLGSAVGCFAGQ